jgi:phosphodiesterase/alkaline phosphatase D-like protein
LASCQYPGTLLDQFCAEASLRALADGVDLQNNADAVLMVGDQIYADATAGLVDPVRRDELFDQPNDKALRLPAMKSVLRRLPVLALCDDHEIRDNWEPLPPVVAQRRPNDEKRNTDLLYHGIAAWRKFQRMQNPPLEVDAVAAGDLEVELAGLPFRFVDTRTGRSARGSTVPIANQRILTLHQQMDLERWLLLHRDEIKFVATPSVLLPRRVSTVCDPVAGFAFSDAWDGYPASLEALLHFIANEQIGRTVFLSGDEHHSFYSEIWVRPCDSKLPSVKIVSVHSSALYAPFPFANGYPSDLSSERSFTLGQVHVEVKSTDAPPGDGFYIVKVDPLKSSIALLAIKGDGQPSGPVSVSLS